MAAFLADPGPVLNGRRDLNGCTVLGCRYGSSGLGLCMRHRHAFTASGHPDPTVWAEAAPATDPAGQLSCTLPFCSLWIEHERNPFCKAHQTRWRMQGCPDVEAFIQRCLLAGRDRIDYGGLPPLLKAALAILHWDFWWWYLLHDRLSPGENLLLATAWLALGLGSLGWGLRGTLRAGGATRQRGMLRELV